MAGSLKAQMELSADASGVEAGVAVAQKRIKTLGDTAAAVGAEASAGLDQIGKAGEKVGDKVDRGTRNLIGAIQRTTAALEAGGRSSAKYFEVLAAQRGVDQSALRPFLDQLAQVEASQQRARASAAQLTPALTFAAAAQNKLAEGQKLTAFQAQQLSFQLNDLFVQIASGQSPLTALIQQGSQLSGTFGGVGGAVRAVTSLFTLGRVATAGLVGAVAGLAFAYEKGAEQSREFANAIILTGNAAGFTEARFNSSVAQITATTNETIRGSREILLALVASGRFSGDALDSAAKATANLAAATGQSADKVVASVITLSSGVAKGAEELNRQYRFLTAEQLDYIKTLEEQGDRQKALAITFNALNDRISGAAQNLGYLESGWLAVKKAASAAIDEMLKVGRVKTPQEALDDIAARAAAQTDGARALGRRPLVAPTVADAVTLQQQIAAAREVDALARRSALLSAQAVDREEAKTALFKLQETLLTKQEQKAKEIAKANALADRAGVSPEQRAKLISNINKKYEDKEGESKAKALAKAQAQFDVEQVRSASQAMVDAYTGAERILEARKAANLVSDREYYDAKRAFIELNTEVQIEALRREIAVQNARKLSGADAIERDREVLKYREQISKLEANRVTAVEVASIQEQAAYRKVTQAIEDAKAAAEDYLATQARKYDRDLAGLGFGNRQREQDAQRAETNDRFLQQRQSLQRDLRRGQLTREQYDAELKIINDANEEALRLDESYFRRRADLQSNFALGAQDALRTYYEETQSVFGQAQQVVASSFKGMEDALVSFVQTGKLDFSSFANSVIADLARIAIRANITGPLAAALGFGDGGGFLGAIGGFLTGGRAIGGPVSAGGLYRVNEKKGSPELLSVAGQQYLMMGDQSGSVSPAAGGAAPTIVINNTIGDVASVSTVQKGMQIVKADILRTLTRSSSMGGSFA